MKNKKIIVIIMILSTLLLSFAAYAIQSAQNANNSIKNEISIGANQDEENIAYLLSQFGVSREEILKLKSELGTWEEVSLKLIEQTKKFSKEQVTELYKQGYGLQDINEAQNLAFMSDASAKELLQEKGKTNEKKSWDNIIKKHKIDTRMLAEKLGMSAEKIKELKSKGFKDNDINNIASLADSFGKDYEVISLDIAKGKTLEELNKTYSEEYEKSEQCKKAEEQIRTKQQNTMKIALKNKYGFTDKEMNEFSQSGMEAKDITIAKLLADKYNSSLSNVINEKKNSKDWSKVISKLGGTR